MAFHNISKVSENLSDGTPEIVKDVPPNQFFADQNKLIFVCFYFHPLLPFLSAVLSSLQFFLQAIS